MAPDVHQVSRLQDKYWASELEVLLKRIQPEIERAASSEVSLSDSPELTNAQERARSYLADLFALEQIDAETLGHLLEQVGQSSCEAEVQAVIDRAARPALPAATPDLLSQIPRVAYGHVIHKES